MGGIKVGIAGCGWISTKAHIPIVKNIQDFILKSLFDSNSSLGKEMCEKWGLDDTSNSLSSFINSDIDAVVIATPNFTHKDLIMNALLKEKWVLCEKPLVLNSNELNQIKRQYPNDCKHIIPAFVNSFRYDIKQLFNELGTIGELKKIEGKWIRKNGIPRPGTWITNKTRAGGGVLIDLGPHILNICLEIIRFFLSTKCVDIKVIAADCDYLNYDSLDKAEAVWFSRKDDTNIKADVEKRISSKMTMNEIEVCLELDWANELIDDFTQFTIHGSKGYVILNTLFGFSTCRKYKEAELLVVTEGKRDFKVIDSEISNQLYAFKEMYMYFAKCIRSGSSGVLDLSMGEDVVKVIDKIYKKLEEAM